ncbi:MAG: hydrogenase maturation protein [Okeania sp. SIO2F4]|uniref:hydrogenase maturation protein n=1 Tax=Okeania sp. SIO2F4 TaxID=2607790 RepID=UPI00142AFD17|nr:hydrogenase maturation protein [Okeania sp. SIO2F4]NES05525.1 hydrogenase maturation protein [Okeania sp. SIO2F4]
MKNIPFPNHHFTPKKKLETILLIASAYNTMTQRFHVELLDMGYKVSVEIFLNDEVTREVVKNVNPDLIIAPFLKDAIPEDVWRKHICIIIHPGIKGDRGPSSLDWAILNNEQEWGVTALQADLEMDAGDIWASTNFTLAGETKSDLYRGKVTQAAITCLKEISINFLTEGYKPEPLDYTKTDVKGSWRNYLKQKQRAINWDQDTTETIVRKIKSADSQPGLLDQTIGQPMYLYGAYAENGMTGTPGEIIAQRNGAICCATVDGAVWISVLKQKNKGDKTFFKLPATLVLKDYLQDIPEIATPITLEPNVMTFRDIWYEQKNEVGYLHFQFYNGAMNTEQCKRLREAYIYARSQTTKVIVLMGGSSFWSNGIHLNVIEAAEDRALESWNNINAMDDFVLEVLSTDNQTTIAAMQANAAAGGVMMALSADYVYAREGIVLNPHYKLMGLYGSEYWTYSLVQRVGNSQAKSLTEKCMPISTKSAQEIGLIDDYYGKDSNEFCHWITQKAEAIAQNLPLESNFLPQEKMSFTKALVLEEHRQRELREMKQNFVSFEYNNSRYNFVYKIRQQNCSVKKNLAVHNCRDGLQQEA